MEPVTHILTGACLARTGLNRRAAYTTLAMAIAAEFPDIDTLWSLRGPVYSFQHHRGITHTFLGIPFEAGLIVALAYALHRWRVHRSTRAGEIRSGRLLTAAPVRWGWLYVWALLALVSHLFLDFTNNYGLRPFFPFNPRWYAASITFIFDPLMFLLLLGALVTPLIFRLVSSEVGARRQPFVARGWSIAALTLIASLWVLRETQHNRAEQLALQQTVSYVAPATANSSTAIQDAALDANAPAPEQPHVLLQAQRVLANPDPFSPFRWWTVTDYGPVYDLGVADTRAASFVPGQQTFAKLAATPAVRAAEASRLGRAYLDWSPMPWITASSAHDEDEGTPGDTVVTFRDPRFMGDVPGLRGRTPLLGTVELNPANQVVRQAMDGKPQP